MRVEINGRYQPYNQIGQGGMGTVYLALDRLTGDSVALKRVRVPTSQLIFYLQDDLTTDHSPRLALAREFKILASLRHPHIISVLDYGFDAEQLPFYTMTYVPGAQTILEAGAALPIAGKINLIRQILQALAYLHRQGIIHRDLKPNNILVSEGTVQVVDFGLSQYQQEDNEAAGSLFYMAPELLREEAVSKASDLYALGVIAYQLFAGQYPFDTTGLFFSKRVQFAKPDLTILGVNDALAQVVGRLLAKQPDDRYARAEDCLAAIQAALQEPETAESEEIRESYLQAATFVGREAELQQLNALLNQAKAGRGQSVLIGGESGVGKSRLINELQTQALVAGFEVLRGQGSHEGGLPYQLWREPLRYLCLMADLSPLTASILLPLVPDLARLLGRTIEPAPELEGNKEQLRIFSAITNLLRQQTRPILLILEDMQWVEESLEALQWLLYAIHDIPLLVVGTYRLEERPTLPNQLPQMSHMQLNRLTNKDVHTLCHHMLSKQGITDRLVDFLQKQSEGNTFFLVEIVRALAQQAGQLETIGQMHLPETVFPAGIATIISQRLANLPTEVKPLLNLAALAGRELNLPLLKFLSAGHISLEKAWLPTLSEAGLLIVEGMQWQFSHAKLREGLLQQLDEATMTTLHRQIAEGLEMLYPDTPSQAANLMRHWSGAGERDKECAYAQQAGRYAQSQNAYQEALRCWNRAEQLLAADEIVQRYEVYLAQEAIYHRQGKREVQRAKLTQLSELASQLDGRFQAELALRWASFARAISDFEQTITYAQQVIVLGEQLGEETFIINGHVRWGEALRHFGDYEQAESHFQTGLKLAQALQQMADVAECFKGLAALAIDRGSYAVAQQYANQALNIQQEIGDRQGESATLHNLGLAAMAQSYIDEAQQYYLQALAIREELGDRKGQGDMLNSLGNVAGDLGDFSRSSQYYAQALTIRQEIGDRRGIATTFSNLGVASIELGEYGQAQHYYLQSLAIRQEIGDRRGEGLVLGNLGAYAVYLGDYGQAQRYYAQSLTIRREIGDPKGESLVLYNLGVVVARQKEYGQAQRYLTDSLAIRQEIGDQRGEGLTFCSLGWVHWEEGRLSEAEVAYQQSLSVLDGLNLTRYVVESKAGLALVKLALGDRAQSLELVSATLSYLKEYRRLNGTDHEMFSYYAVWSVLTELGRVAEAAHVLSLATDVLQAYLDKQPDSDQQAMYLSQRYHQILWKAGQESQRS